MIFDHPQQRRFQLPVLALSMCVGVVSFIGAAQSPAQTQSAAHAPGEMRAEQAFDAAKKMGPGEMYAFLRPMPKGGDLHMHLSGAVYAETFIAEAVKSGLCIAPVSHGTPPVPEGQDAVRFAKADSAGGCPSGDVPAAAALKGQALYNDLIDSFSMRAFVPTEGIDGHDQFFATFERFSGLHTYDGAWLDEVVRRAAAQNEQYLEVMQTPSFSHAVALADQIGWPQDARHEISRDELATLRTKLLAAGLKDEVAGNIAQFNQAMSGREALEHCSAAMADVETNMGDATVAYGPPHEDDSAACKVEVRWIYQVLRGFPPQQVFAQTLLGFEVASADPDVVGLNYVMPEDGRISMEDYHLQMEMLDYLHSVYPKVHITLHAGELAPGMVPPDGMRFHIREAVELGHAERIGHGVDVLYEDHPYELLAEMARKHVMVEINLTSNDVILGIKGKQHPLHAYIAAHVPVALSTDDEGVSRIDLTHEFVKAAEEQDIDYYELKRMARTSLEHSFLPGESLWAREDEFTQKRAGCPAVVAPDASASGSCAAFLAANPRAAQQFELERRFAVFEAHAGTMPH